MKRTLIAVGTLVACGTVAAQSSVTLFGVVDAAMSNYKATSRETSTGRERSVSRTAMVNSGYNTSRLGFRGVEDLGGGLAASFWLESPLSNDDGSSSLAFSRRSTVSLSGAFGEVRAGRDNLPTFWNDTVYDPFGTNGVGTNLIFSASNLNLAAGAGGFGGNVNNVRNSNSIAYFLPPNLGGVYGQLQYALHENTKYDPAALTPPVPNNSRTGRYVGGRLGYLSGPLDVAAAAGNSTVGDNFQAGTTDAVKTASLGAAYDFGLLKLMGEFSRVKNTHVFDGPGFRPMPPDTVVSGYLIGFTAPVGPAMLRGSYARVTYDFNTPGRPDASARKLALGIVYNLSKRTALYATAARVNDRDGAALTVGGSGPAFPAASGVVPRSSTGYDLGVRVAF
ncbi:MAG: porin [Variovorax sp.]|nr:porin [Variovorax sp.]